MKNLLDIRMLVVVVVLAIGFSSCQKDTEVEPETGEPEDVVVVIDDNQTFIQSNFIKSFEQVIDRYDVPAFDEITHEYTNGVLTKSYHNHDVHGKFGAKYMSTTHILNDDGAITSSRVDYIEGDYFDEWVYEFDTEGFIIKMYDKNNDDEEDENSYRTFEYNTEGLLIQKKFVREGGDYPYSEEETFEYNSNQNLIKAFENGALEHEYIYTDGKVTSEKYYNDIDGTIGYIAYYEYNSDGLMTKKYGDSYLIDFEYKEDYYQHIEYYSSGALRKIYKSDHFTWLKETWFYRYNEEDEFSYCIYRDTRSDDREAILREYYTGSIDNLILVGYATYSKDAQDKLISSFYDTKDKLQYQFKYDDTDWWTWYDKFGEKIEYESDVEEWALRLRVGY